MFIIKNSRIVLFHRFPESIVVLNWENNYVIWLKNKHLKKVETHISIRSWNKIVFDFSPGPGFWLMKSLNNDESF